MPQQDRLEPIILHQPKAFLSYDKVFIREVPGVFSPHEELRQLIDSGWEMATERMTRLGWPFYNGPMTRYEGFEATGDGLVFLASHSIGYKDVIGLRAHPYSAFRDFSYEFLPRAFTVMNVLITSDNKIVLGYRRTGDWDESYELSGGFVKPESMSSALDGILYWLRRDFLITKEEVAGSRLVAFVYYPPILEFMMVFVTQLFVSSSEILLRKGKGEFHSDILCFEDSLEEWVRLKGSGVSFHPPSAANLELYMKLKTDDLKLKTRN